ncbi:MAG TPA: ABC transporter permease [Anaerolineales bacterium]|nr:ABC transporter permease [Anaerolineales bacterium]
MMRLAIRNLFQSRARLAISVGGVALALMLIIALDAIVGWIEARVTAYIEASGADIWVAQEGVRNMHMASSSFSSSLASGVARVEQVESATPILYLTNVVEAGPERALAYIIGLPDRARAGMPSMVTAGSATPGRGGAVIDEGVARASDIGLGDTVEVLGEEFEVVGLSAGTASLTNSIAFISSKDFGELLANPRVASFLLVRVAPGASPDQVARRIEAQVRGVTAQTTEAFAAQERKVVRDMSTDLMAIMNLVAFLIGLAVMSLTVYTATLGRRAEYGVLKALGARSRDLYLTVGAQALVSVGMGLAVGLVFTLALAAIMPRFSSNLGLLIRVEALGKATLAAIIFAGGAALLPIRQIRGLDPALVFRGR